MNIYLVPVEFVPREWDSVYDLLKPAVERSGRRWSMPALLRGLCMGDLQLWVVREGNVNIAAATTQIAEYPHIRMLNVQFLGGKEFDHWGEELLMRLEQFARDAHCMGVEAVGRFGFWPFFKDQGYKKSYCTYELMFEESVNGQG